MLPCYTVYFDWVHSWCTLFGSRFAVHEFDSDAHKFVTVNCVCTATACVRAFVTVIWWVAECASVSVLCASMESFRV